MTQMDPVIAAERNSRIVNAYLLLLGAFVPVRGSAAGAWSFVRHRASSRSQVRAYAAASLCPSLAFSLWISASASAITVPGGKIASAPALISAS